MLPTESGQAAPAKDAGSRGIHGGVHIVDGAEDHDIEAAVRRHLFDTFGPNFGFEAERSDGFAEEGSLFTLRLGQGHLKLGEEQLDGQAGETGAGAEVQKSGRRRQQRREVDTGEEAFAEVAADDLFGVADGREIGAGVPAEKEVKVSAELGVEVGRDGRAGEVGFEERGDLGFAEDHGRCREAAS